MSTEKKSDCCFAKIIIEEDWIDPKEVIIWNKCSKCGKYCQEVKEAKKPQDTALYASLRR